MEFDYIIVQAGGRGTRLRHLTENKPKALVPVYNLPMIFHLFRLFPDKRFIIIADYKKEVLKNYLECFAKIKFLIVEAQGTGTCGGIAQAARLLPDSAPFLLLWSDLILSENTVFPEDAGNYVGISKTFQCRWSYADGVFTEQPSSHHGVAGLFLFADKSQLDDVPESGEFVRWMQKNGKRYRDFPLEGTREFGRLSEYEKLEIEKCRPFNRIIQKGCTLIKEGIDEQGKQLAARECAWYKKAAELKINTLPAVYHTDPLELELINGKNVYEYYFTRAEKRSVLEKLAAALHSLHRAESYPADPFSMKKAYFYKTFERILAVRELVPFANAPVIHVNGKKCRNVFFHKRELEKKLEDLYCGKFCFLHGDCTFSNIMLRNGSDPVLIDPRGYFGFTSLYGDPRYDWAKLYYSIIGNYDQFNLKKFRLSINSGGYVELKIESNQWEDMEADFFELSETNPKDIKLLHAVIWLSLTTYAWQDYDSICGAFYNGLYYLEEVL